MTHTTHTTSLLDYLRSDLEPLMKRRAKLALRAVRDAIGTIENAETQYVLLPSASPETSSHLAGVVPFGMAERIVNDLSDADMTAIVTTLIENRLDEAARLRDSGRVDEALTLKAEARELQDRLDAYAALV